MALSNIKLWRKPLGFALCALLAPATVLAAAAPRASQPIALDALEDWQQFRYRTFETLVPIRNMTWLPGAAGC